MRLCAAAAMMFVAGSCSSASVPATTRSALPTPVAKASTLAGGCGVTQVASGGAPAWLIQAAGGSSAPSGVPYVVATPAIAGGFIFGYPLRAGHPDNPTNKILWVVRNPREGSQLELDGRPLGAELPTVHFAEPANSSPGEVYPTIVDVPTAGCWQFSLHWAQNQADIQLAYVAP